MEGKCPLLYEIYSLCYIPSYTSLHPNSKPRDKLPLTIFPTFFTSTPPAWPCRPWCFWSTHYWIRGSKYHVLLQSLRGYKVHWLWMRWIYSYQKIFSGQYMRVCQRERFKLLELSKEKVQSLMFWWRMKLNASKVLQAVHESFQVTGRMVLLRCCEWEPSRIFLINLALNSSFFASVWSVNSGIFRIFFFPWMVTPTGSFGKKKK